jgi:hypothetical protein
MPTDTSAGANETFMPPTLGGRTTPQNAENPTLEPAGGP